MNRNFTTSEQTKRLLELGLPMDSADCVHTLKTNRVFFIQNGKVTEGYLSLYKAVRGEEAEPCWSVGQLIKIYYLCTKKMPLIENENCIFYLMKDYELGIVSKQLDFSKIKEL